MASVSARFHTGSGQRRQRHFDWPRPLYAEDRSLARLSLL